MQQFRNVLAWLALVAVYYTVRFYFILNPSRTVLAFSSWMSYNDQKFPRKDVGISDKPEEDKSVNELILSYTVKALWVWLQVGMCVALSFFLPIWGAIAFGIVVPEIVLFTAKKSRKNG
jgi:hypothetical protein